jgi:hypothetical protein
VCVQEISRQWLEYLLHEVVDSSRFGAVHEDENKLLVLYSKERLDLLEHEVVSLFASDTPGLKRWWRRSLKAHFCYCSDSCPDAPSIVADERSWNLIHMFQTSVRTPSIVAGESLRYDEHLYSCGNLAFTTRSAPER